jgi:hypothetical protein
MSSFSCPEFVLIPIVSFLFLSNWLVCLSKRFLQRFVSTSPVVARYRHYFKDSQGGDASI